MNDYMVKSAKFDNNRKRNDANGVTCYNVVNYVIFQKRVVCQIPECVIDAMRMVIL